VDFTSHATLWSATAAGPPTLAPAPGRASTTTALADSQIVVPTGTGVQLLAGATGSATCPAGQTCSGASIDLPGAPAREIYRYGTGFVLAGTATAVSQ
jgi:hypothetical protein